MVIRHGRQGISATITHCPQSGQWVIGLTTQATSVVPAEIRLALTGLGMGLATGPLMGVAVGAVSAARSDGAAAARMIGAALDVAALGAVFAVAEGGPQGWRLARFPSGRIRIVAASVAWRGSRPQYKAPR